MAGVFAFLVAALFVVSLGFGILTPLLPDVAARSGLSSEATLALAYSTYSFAKISIQIPAGYAADRIGGDRIVRWALLAYVLAMGCMTQRLPMAGFVLARFAEGAAEGALYPSGLQLLRARTRPEVLGQRIGLALGIGSSGLLIGPVLGAWLSQHGVAAVTGVAASIGALLWLVQRFVLGHTDHPHVDAGAAAASTRERVRELRRLVMSRQLLGIALPVAFNKLMTSGFFALFPLLVAQHFGGEKMITAAFFLASGLSFVVAQLIGGRLADRYPLAALLRAYVPLLLLATGALGWMRTPFAFGGALLLQTFLQTCILLACLRALATFEGGSGKAADQFGGLFGALATSTDLFTIAGPPLALLLFSRFGLGAFWALSAMGVLFYCVRACVRPRPLATVSLPRKRSPSNP